MSVKYGLLALLRSEPMYGYQLKCEFEEKTGSTWPLNIGQVYTTLQRLERDGLVVELVAGDDAQRTYTITDAGRESLEKWFATPVDRDNPPRDELVIKLAVAVTLPGVDVREVIQAQRSATIVALQHYTKAKASGGDDLAWLLVIDSLIFAAEAEIRWLDHCEGRVARAASEYKNQKPRPASPSDSKGDPRRPGRSGSVVTDVPLQR